MSQTGIEWTDATWNPVTGCDRVSPGCAHCYALDLAARLKRMGQPRYQRDGGRSSGPGFGVTLHPDKLGEPLRWRKPRKVFVNSMSDLFHDQVPDDFICRVFDVMRACQAGVGLGVGHTFQVLTKRPERMRDVCRRLRFNDRGKGRVWLADAPEDLDGYALMGGLSGCRPLPNVWLGVSIENRRFVGRADVLRDTPAAVRFISAEPLIGPLVCPSCKDNGSVEPWGGYPGGAACPRGCADGASPGHDHCGPSLELTGIDWLIVGGESGPGHRPMRLEWARDLLDACRHSDPGTAFFCKQLGGTRPGTALEDLPPDLRVREWPTTA